MTLIDTVSPISPGELERRTYWIDIADEEGQRYRYHIPRLVAKLLEERAAKIAELQSKLDQQHSSKGGDGDA